MIHQALDEFIQLFTLRRGSLQEFDSHAALWMRHADDALDLRLNIGDTDGERHFGPHGEGCIRLQVTAAGAEISEFAWNWRIGFFEFWGVAIEPSLQLIATFAGKVDEAKSGLPAGIRPSHFHHAFDLVFSSRQSKCDRHGTCWFAIGCGLNRNSTFAQVRGYRALRRFAFTEANRYRNFNRDAGIPPAFAFHQGAGGTKAGLGAFV